MQFITLGKAWQQVGLSWESGNRKAHFNHTQEVGGRREGEAGPAYKTSKPACSDVLPSTMLTSPNSNWRPRFLVHEPLGDFSHSNHHRWLATGTINVALPCPAWLRRQTELGWWGNEEMTDRQTEKLGSVAWPLWQRNLNTLGLQLVYYTVSQGVGLLRTAEQGSRYR